MLKKYIGLIVGLSCVLGFTTSQTNAQSMDDQHVSLEVTSSLDTFLHPQPSPTLVIEVGESLYSVKEREEKAKQEIEDKKKAEEEAARIAQEAAGQALVKASQITAPPTPAPKIEPVAQQPVVLSDVEGKIRDATILVWGEEQWPALRSIIMAESGMNPNAYNPTSGACGLFQALPCSKMGGMAVENQISWGIQYVKERYGSPSNAWRFWRAHSWY